MHTHIHISLRTIIIFGFRFNENDAFIGYSPDTSAAVVLQASVIVENSDFSASEGSPEWSDKVCNYF